LVGDASYLDVCVRSVPVVVSGADAGGVVQAVSANGGLSIMVA
jgi:hypothetical protein